MIFVSNIVLLSALQFPLAPAPQGWPTALLQSSSEAPLPGNKDPSLSTPSFQPIDPEQMRLRQLQRHWPSPRVDPSDALAAKVEGAQSLENLLKGVGASGSRPSAPAVAGTPAKPDSGAGATSFSHFLLLLLMSMASLKVKLPILPGYPIMPGVGGMAARRQYNPFGPHHMMASSARGVAAAESLLNPEWLFPQNVQYMPSNPVDANDKGDGSEWNDRSRQFMSSHLKAKTFVDSSDYWDREAIKPLSMDFPGYNPDTWGNSKLSMPGWFSGTFDPGHSAYSSLSYGQNAYEVAGQF